MNTYGTYGAYNYGYGGRASSASSSFAGLGIVAIILAIAVIVLSIVLYRKFVGKKANPNSSMTKFFRFDHLFIDKFIKFFFILDALAIAAFCIYLPFLGATSGIGGFFAMLFLGILLLVILEVVNRLLYEGVMLFVRLVIDVGDIRSKIVGGKSMSDMLEDSSNAAAGYAEKVSESSNKAKENAVSAVSAVREKKPASSQNGASSGDNKSVGDTGATVNNSAANNAPASTDVQNSAANAQPAGNGWECPNCGSHNPAGSFCAKCGCRRP